MKQLQGKVSIVTGGGSGIGEACATVFAEELAQVLVADALRARVRYGGDDE